MNKTVARILLALVAVYFAALGRGDIIVLIGVALLAGGFWAAINWKPPSSSKSFPLGLV